MEVEKDDAKFESKLDDASRKKAKDELNELNDKDRAIAVQTLRKWIVEQDWLKSPTDFAFLLRFLRVKKFSQLEARRSIERYWTAKTTIPSWFKDAYLGDETLQEILRTGFYICPKKYDKHGRRIVFIRLGKLGLDNFKNKWGIDGVCKACMLIYDWLILDENVQVNGLCIICDYTDVSLQLMMAMSTPDVTKNSFVIFRYERDLIFTKFPDKFVKVTLNSLPIRLKAVHLYNEPAFFDGIYQMMAPFMKQKLKDRVYLHGKSLVKIFEDVGMPAMLKEYLPDEYTGPSLGDTNDILKEMIADMIKPEFVEYMKNLSSGRYGVDVEKRKVDDAPVESFRKLNVD